jgi:hypothetical protein
VAVPRLLGFLLLSLILGGFSLPPATAQEAGNFAFLVRQPEREVSVPVLPANDSPSISATYATGESAIEVFVVPVGSPPVQTDGGDNAGFLATDWEPALCAGVALERFVSVEVGRTVLRTDRREYSLYLAAATGSSDLLCTFAAAFVESFEFFLAELPGNLRQGPPPEFPAVVELAPATP